MMSFINLAELWNTVNEINIGMFTTVDRRGNLTSRPLITQQIEAGGVMWFFSSLQPRQAEDLLRQPHANVSFCDNAELFYVSLSGKALLVRDRSCHARLWNPMARAWFPRGMNDSQLVLVQFPVAIVEYWDADAGSMVELQNEVDTAVGARQRAALR